MNVIDVRGVTKTYRMGVGRGRVREMLPWPLDRGVARLFPRWWMRNTFNALEELSLSVPRGASIGIVGHNGAGKTTLLKVIAGVTRPAAGSVTAEGRIAALIDAVVGFHSDLTGRENVYLLGAMHGVGRKQMARRMESVLDFAEIHELADTPVKRYSAGMLARLGFAVIASLEPTIVLVDEVLAVGDALFQRKCIDWLDEYRRGDGTLLFVSHNLSLVRHMTERVVWIERGKVVDDGPTDDVLARYARAMESRGQDQAMARKSDVRKAMRTSGQNRWGSGGARVQEVHLSDPSTNGGGLDVSIAYESDELGHAIFCLSFVDEGGNKIGGTASPAVALQAGIGEVHCTIDPFPLHPGIYFPVVSIVSMDGDVRDHWRLERAVVLEANGAATHSLGPVRMASTWANR